MSTPPTQLTHPFAPPRSAGRVALAVGLIAAFLFTACVSARQNDPRESLPESLRDFHNQLVWGRFAQAAGYLPEGQRAHFIGAYEEVRDEIRFVEYELGAVDADAETQEAIVMVTLSWYRVPHYIVQETRVRQTWAVDESNDYWWLVRREDPDALVSSD